MHEIDVVAQSEPGHQVPEMVLAGEQVGRGRHMDENIDVGGVHSGVGDGGEARPERQITVEQAAVSAASLALSAEVVVQPPLMDAEVSDDPLGLQGPDHPGERDGGTGESPRWRPGGPARTNPHPNRDRHARPQPRNRDTSHRIHLLPSVGAKSTSPRFAIIIGRLDRPNRGGSPSLHLVSRIEPQLTTL